MTNPIAKPTLREETEHLYEVPFTFILRGTYITLASSAAEATKRAASLLDYDPDILPVSNSFWEDGTPVFDLECDGPTFAPTILSKRDPDDLVLGPNPEEETDR